MTVMTQMLPSILPQLKCLTESTTTVTVQQTKDLPMRTQMVMQQKQVTVMMQMLPSILQLSKCLTE